ncbi:hypothetical protein Smp_183040 [Schistosoma mansoni]|uniref:hypothetical protein n=1 Tax=Schistosoma mansoni TaxID=6183 RepID=UPI00022C83F7|nr:hypothetical protein Smp_183040 [Schistosoma mansoni]|eukprot:XP_018645351.1 hypothetical protein Smp_183040 [Schistosoma mansoni]
MEVQPLDATWNMSSRVASCTTLTAETAHDRPGSESSNLTTTRTEAHKAAKKPAPNWTDTYLISACLTRPPEPSFSRSYGSNLPTSLTYIVHCQRLFPWRPAADMGTACHENILPRSDFQGRQERSGHHKKGGALRRLAPYLRTSRFQGVDALLTKKRELFPELSPTSPRSVAYRAGRTPNQRPDTHQSPWTGSGILTRFPFATGGCNATVLADY